MKIIVADDHYTNRLLVTEILKCLGHDSIEAENGKDVLEALELHNDVDMVLMDIEMPVMNGRETTRYIREMLDFPKNMVPVIALTGHSEDIYNESYCESGFNQSLMKPFSFESIAEILEGYNKKLTT
jgi:CheY-like chemotaxis protein